MRRQDLSRTVVVVKLSFMQNRSLIPLLAFVCFFCSLVFETRGRADQSSDATAYFETHIRPLLIERCYACHSHRDNKGEGNLFLDTRRGWMDGGENGSAIIPGDVDASLLIQAVRYSDDLQMPPDTQLDKQEIAKLEHWVRMGAPDPRDAAEISRQPHPSDPISGRTHWAFRPLSKTRVPAISHSWPKTTIDRFIFSAFESKSLSPVGSADRRTLARRTFIRLIGIPPTPHQVDRFLADERPDAFAKLVDRLLATPQFGERWGRHWLDLVRYADSNGLDENFLFREAWRYRNWVIEAINSDTPFDRFVLHQIAGDLLPFDSIEQRDAQRTAAGFLVVGPKVLLGNDPQNQRMEVADEQLDTIGRSLLGQTLGCARCHDHKFDPIPTADYYAMAGIFTSTKVMQRRYMLGQQRVMERLVGLGPNENERNDAYEKYWRERPQLKKRLANAKSARELLKKDNKEFAEFAKKNANAIAATAIDSTQPLEKRQEAQQRLVKELQEAFAKPPAIPPRAMIPCDVESPDDEYIRLAGQFNRKGRQVKRSGLQVLSQKPFEIEPGKSGREELARWLADTQYGAGQLTARVLANRVWYHMMGRGIVRTVDNFGRTGESPSHPDLLDYLAAGLIDSGWSTKWLIREIALSSTFQLASDHNDHCNAIDPENKFFWRYHRRRVEPEVMRDAMLLAAGELDLRPMDSSVWYLGDQATAVGDNKNRRRTDFSCRSVYLPVIRNDLPELFDVFDFANPHATTGMRPQTMVATQGLFLLNDASVFDAADKTAQRLLQDNSPLKHESNAIVDSMFRWILNSVATPEDHAKMRAFISRAESDFRDQGVTDPRRDAWSLACHTLFASSRFQLLE